MKAWQIVAKEEIAFGEKKQETLPTDVKIRISKVALSSTDIAIYEGKKACYPIIPARSAVGLVSEAHELSGLKKGDTMKVDICNKCHPFFTGRQKLVDTGGRVDKFKKRYNLD